jgi:hypothetical protein
MMSLRQSQPRTYFSVMLIALGMTVAGCAPPRAQAPRLRIKNQGQVTVKNLSVLFPEEEVGFGDVPAGVTTQYKEVPRGVYHYSAFRLELNGKMITQVVEDWVGEEPMGEGAYTYAIDVDPSRGERQIVRLINVSKD